MTIFLSHLFFKLKTVHSKEHQKRTESLDLRGFFGSFIFIIKIIFSIGVTGFEPSVKFLIPSVFAAFLHPHDKIHDKKYKKRYCYQTWKVHHLFCEPFRLNKYNMYFNQHANMTKLLYNNQFN